MLTRHCRLSSGQPLRMSPLLKTAGSVALKRISQAQGKRGEVAEPELLKVSGESNRYGECEHATTRLTFAIRVPFPFLIQPSLKPNATQELARFQQRVLLTSFLGTKHRHSCMPGR
jgi:hypothetical protein